MKAAISYFYGYYCHLLEVQDLNRPLNPSDILSVLVDAEVKCLQGVQSADLDQYLIVSPGAAHGEPLCSPCFQGCYSECWAGSYARMDAWKSLAAMVGVPYSAGLEAIEQEANKCIFLSFSAEKGDFFQYCGNNVGLALLRPDKKTISVLCITDSD
eukprot:Phypoly_transcript_22838.p1 GENE.Phypoly_transcript_22838~~Phypoly_transcript_22838.p1  ORF type:complete len:156 (+),score=8.58 Phypoly_transcript_22838:102-569(+)